MPLGEQRPRAFWRLEHVGRLARQEEELPASPKRAGGYHCRRPLRVTDLEVLWLPHAIAIVRQHIDHGPVVEEAAVLDLGRDDLPDPTVCTITSDDVPGG